MRTRKSYLIGVLVVAASFVGVGLAAEQVVGQSTRHEWEIDPLEREAITGIDLQAQKIQDAQADLSRRWQACIDRVKGRITREHHHTFREGDRLEIDPKKQVFFLVPADVAAVATATSR